MKVQLSKSEQRVSRGVGAMRSERVSKRNYADQSYGHSKPKELQEMHHVMGAMGEMAWAKELGVCWDLDLDGFGRPDLYDCRGNTFEVKTSSRRYGLDAKADNGETYRGLAVVENIASGIVDLMGWVDAQELRDGRVPTETRQSKGGKPYDVVRLDNLREPEELKDILRTARVPPRPPGSKAGTIADSNRGRDEMYSPAHESDLLGGS